MYAGSCQKWKSRFVFGSTSDVYGKSLDLPFRESSDLVLGPSTVSRWGYASSKLFDEHLCFANQRRYGIPATVIRYFNTYGPRHDLTIKSGGPQALFFDALLKGGRMTIHGDGSQRRCFSYVSDTIEMTARIVENQITEGEIINVGNPSGEISIAQLAQLAWEAVDGRGSAPIDFIPHEKFYQTGKFEEISRRVPDITKAIRLLGYLPVVSIRQGLEWTLDWQRNQARVSEWRQRSMTLKIIIPAWNEAGQIGTLFDRLLSVSELVKREWKVFLIDDGSTDATAAEAERYQGLFPLSIIRHQENRRSVRSFQDGLRCGNERIVCRGYYSEHRSKQKLRSVHIAENDRTRRERIRSRSCLLLCARRSGDRRSSVPIATEQINKPSPPYPVPVSTECILTPHSTGSGVYESGGENQCWN